MSHPANIYVAVIDDDESLCRSLGRLLRAAGMQPITYPSAEAFLADAKHPRFDCLLLDVQLSGMSGIELQQQLSGEFAGMPVIFLTAHDDPESRAQAEARGSLAYFHKTEKGERIIAAIREAIAPTL